MLDAGHFGKTNQSPVVPEYYESEMTWKLQNFLFSALGAYGFTVGMTRPDQTKDLEVWHRGIKAKGYDLFISLHSNACGTESVDRVVGIHLVEDNRTNADEISKEITQRLAVGVAEFMKVQGGAQYYSRFDTGDRDGNGKADDNYYGVLHGARTVNVPGIILEHGFHTNAAVARWLLDDNNLKNMANFEAAMLAELCGKVCKRKPGDVNGDGEVSAIDALLVKKAVLGNITLSPEEFEAADVNHDGSIGAMDYLMVKKSILGNLKLN
jgi:N-acetylmuramoyl-L-alanine amidase